MNNENKNLSKNRKERIDRRNKKNDDMIVLLKKINLKRKKT